MLEEKKTKKVVRTTGSKKADKPKSRIASKPQATYKPKVAKKVVVKKESKEEVVKKFNEIHGKLKEAKKAGDKEQISKLNKLFNEVVNKLSLLQ